LARSHLRLAQLTKSRPVPLQALQLQALQLQALQ
jgi:hypothetical protein